MFKHRSIADYDVDVGKIPDARKVVKSTVCGVKSDCVLNQINGYHVTGSWSLDKMHIVLEGIVPVEIGCVLYGLCEENKLMTLKIVKN